MKFLFSGYPRIMYPNDPRYSYYLPRNSYENKKVPGRYPCEQCGKVYRWYRNLTTHLRLECGKEPTHACPYCPRIVKHKTSLRSHVRRVHNMII